MMKNKDIAKINFSKICDKFLGQTITCNIQVYSVAQIKLTNIRLKQDFQFDEWVERQPDKSLPQFKDCFEIPFEAESEVKGVFVQKESYVQFPVFVSKDALFKNNKRFIFKYGLIFDCLYCEVEAEEVGLSVLNEI